MTEVARLSDIEEYDEQGVQTSVYLNEKLINEINELNKTNETRPRQSKVYRIGDSIFEETEPRNVTETEGYVEFELYKEKVYNNTMDYSDFFVSDTHLSEVEDSKSDKVLNITIQKVPHGIIINSNVYLTDHQWNTMIFIDVKMTKCFVCGIYCEVQSCSDHIQSYDHKKNLDTHKPLEKFDLSITRKINKNYHCGVCNEMFHASAMGDHETSKIHEGNLLFSINKVTDIMYDFNIHKENNNDEKSDCYYFDAIAINNNEDSSVTSYYYGDEDDDDDGTSMNDVTEAAFEGPSYASMARKPKLNIPKYFKVSLGSREVSVKCDYWHMIIKTELNRFYCMICKVHDHIKYKTLHCINCEHVEKLAKCTIVNAFGNHLVRMVNDKFYHCGHCNNLQYKHEMLVHIESVHPKKDKNLVEEKPCNSPTPMKMKRNKKQNRKNENTAFDSSETDIFGDIVISPFGNKQTIQCLSYNTILKRDGECYCCLCDVICPENLFEHIHSLLHIQAMQMTPFIRPFSCNLTRAVRGSLHCALCNVLVSVSDIYEHNMQSAHTTLVAKVLGLKPGVKTASENAANQAQCSNSSNQTLTNSPQTSIGSVQMSTSQAQARVQAQNISQSHTVTSASASLQTKTPQSPCGAKSNPNNPRTDPIETRTNFPVPQTKPIGTQNKNSVPEKMPIGTQSNFPMPQTKPIGTQNDVPVPQIKPIETQNNVPRPKVNPTGTQIAMPQVKPIESPLNITTSQINATGPQNAYIKQEPAQIGARVNSPILTLAGPFRPYIAPFRSQNNNHAPVSPFRPQLDTQRPASTDPNFSAPQFSPTKSQNYPNVPLKSPFSSQRNTPSPQSIAQIASGSSTICTKEDNFVEESKNQNDENLPQMSEVSESVNESELDELMESTYDPEEYVYVKLRNIYLRITFSSYNSLVHLGDTWRHCFVCSLNIEANELRRHVDSRAHLENVQKYKFVEKYDKHLIRQIYLTYHCSICNVLVSRRDLKTHLKWPTHVNQIEIKQKISKRMRKNEIKSGVKQYVVDTQKETIFLNEKEHMPKVHINAVIVNKNTPIHKSKIIIFNDTVLKVNNDNWNGITRAKTGGKCIVCQTEVAENAVDEHLSSGDHKENLGKKFDLQCELALIRKVNDTILNCVICNIELPSSDISISDHINGKKHIKNFEAMLKESSSCNTYSDCDEDILTLTN